MCISNLEKASLWFCWFFRRLNQLLEFRWRKGRQVNEFKYSLQIIADDSVGLRTRTSYPRNHFNHSFGSDLHIRRKHIPFFILPRFTLSLLVVNRQTYNHIEQRPVTNAFVLEARVRNVGRAVADRARISLKIDNVTADYELHAWQALEFASISGGGYSQRSVASLLPLQWGLSYIVSVSPDLPYAFIVTLYNQMTGQTGHRLELDKEYKASIEVIGDFKTQRWSFTFTPRNNQIVVTEPVKI